MTVDGALSAPAHVVDPDALVAAMFAREGAALVRLARIFCDDRDAAEDLVQEAFIRLHRSSASIRDIDRAPAFLRSIVINLSRDHNRRGLMSHRHRSTRQRVTGPPEPDDLALADDESRQVIRALRTLPERQRACLVLHYYQQLSIADTAETLGISVNSVKTHCRRGLAALEARLGKEAE